jgi:transient receptor potential cation channel subfamily M protein 3
LLTQDLVNWSHWTCISLAFSANLKEFLSHTACQTLISELWLGGMRSHKYAGLKVTLVLLEIKKMYFLFTLHYLDIADLDIFSSNISNSIQISS